MNRVSKASDLRQTLVSLSLEKFATTLRADFRFAPLNVLLQGEGNRTAKLFLRRPQES